MAGQKAVKGSPAAGGSTSFPVREAGTEESWVLQCLNVFPLYILCLGVLLGDCEHESINLGVGGCGSSATTVITSAE